MQQDVHSAMERVLESGRFILGEAVEELETQIAAFCGAKYGVAVNSGTDALLIGLAAMGVGPGDEVITTPFTFVATVEAICHLGAKPVFADIDPGTFNLCPEQVRRKITPRTRAILPVDLFGQPADRHAFEAIAAEHGLLVLYDSAQAVGARFDGQGIAGNGATCTLSFFPTKNLGAFGDGGMILTSDEGVMQSARALRFHGSGGDYRYQKIGYCSRLDALQAAILLVKLQRLEQWTEARRAHAAVYRECLKGTRCVLPTEDPRVYHVYHQFTVRHPERDALRAHLASRGIQTGVYYPSALHLEEAYRFLGYAEGDLPEAERACREVVSLPVHPELTPEQQEHVCQAVLDFESNGQGGGSDRSPS